MSADRLGSTLKYLLEVRERRGAGYLTLLDPDRLSLTQLEERAVMCAEAGADAILVGTSLMLSTAKNASVFQRLREVVDMPVISFPGDAGQVVPTADAIFFLSMISGRNPELLIGQQVRAAPLLKEYGVELPKAQGRERRKKSLDTVAAALQSLMSSIDTLDNEAESHS